MFDFCLFWKTTY